jgi:hypothetical protein
MDGIVAAGPLTGGLTAGKERIFAGHEREKDIRTESVQ